MGLLVAFQMVFTAEALGVGLGILLLYLFNIENKRLIGMLFGSTAGIMLAMIFFDILPEAFEQGNFYLVAGGTFVGVFLGLSLQSITHYINQKLDIAQIQDAKMFQTGISLLIGIAIHNIPEGFAFGSLSITSQETIVNFAIAIFLHSIPETIAVMFPLKKAGVKASFLCMLPIVLGLVMGAGAILGYIFSRTNDVLIVLSLGLASGIILYIICEDLLPESKHIWNGRMTSVATIIGVLTGYLLVNF
ncbi:ZIP family metal transporter [Candidatus Epulonipiscium viviparus]|uniref:ZIP family metal transporter n=1 Tax=Candidatus Epulonipiscium viviparus TaxID=420336 RepID=UPI00016BFE14|nr:ZIP family metal transporter [Candidatus Epulopiscium viviparus]